LQGRPDQRKTAMIAHGKQIFRACDGRTQVKIAAFKMDSLRGGGGAALICGAASLGDGAAGGLC